MTVRAVGRTGLALLSLTLGAGCGAHGQGATDSGDPPAATVEHENDGASFQVDRPERFSIVTATQRTATPELSVTGVVTPDVSRTVPVLSLASGRVVEIRARLGDQVTKGQLLLRLHSAEVSDALADYRKAVADQALAQAQLDRTSDLVAHGALAKKDLEIAQNAADKAKDDVADSADHLHLLGSDPDSSGTGLVDILAPASGVIIEQNVTESAGVRTLDNSPNLFTIADLSRVWILCDVYENDLASVHLGDPAIIHPTAYPDKTLTGRIDNIGSVLDPALHTVKVRVEVANPGLLRVGMFVTAALHGQGTVARAVVPASAIVHLHDREWVYLAAEPGHFTRQEVVSGLSVPGGLQEILSGLQPGARVVANALALQSTVDQ